MTPWTGLATMKKEMDRLFERAWEGDFPPFPALGEWNPAMDLAESKDAYVVKAEVPGMDPKDIQVSLQDQVLTLRGEKRQDKEEKDGHYVHAERTYGAFTRTIRLPGAVEAARVTATFKHGVVTVTLPKAPAAKGTCIPVKTE